MKVEIGRRYKVKGFSVIVTVVIIYDDVHVEVAYDNSVTGVMAAGNCVTPSIYDEIRDFDDQEMEDFFSEMASFNDVGRALYWVKANRLFKAVDKSLKEEIMYRHWNTNDAEWVGKALQELWISNYVKGRQQQW